MSAARTIPDHVRGVQIEAANPEISAFVSANAGSGKTYVLAQRVINLLLRGVDPAKILCITFTKTAAANMANEVFKRLASWTALDDAALDEQIRLSTGKTPSAGERARGRRLFASALETPGGLKVQTIHAFCTRLLHQFPFEAGVAARFSVLDEPSTTQLLDRLTLEVLLQAAADPDGPLGKALATAIVVAADIAFKEVIGDAIKARDAIEGWIERAGGVDNAIAQLSKSFGIADDDSLDKVEQEFFSASLIPQSEWPSLIEILAQGAKSDKGIVDSLAAIREASGRARIDHYLRIFCTAELSPRKSLVTKALADRHPEWLARLQDEQARICALLDRERALSARERTRALIIIAKEVIDRYLREKERRALLDYDDLIDRTLALFKNVSAAWVLYKLDLGIDHILIDEAQDTSPKQWEIIKTIAAEFMPGGSRPNTRRTLFAVGDEKQSIFSFQGAAPEAFDVMRRLFAQQFDRPDLGWKFLRFHHSFRSGAAVLGSVDQVFSAREIYESITADVIGIPKHESLPDAAPGLVELWSLIEPAEKKEIEGWDAPFDTESEKSPRVLLAQKIAKHVKLWCANGLAASEVLVLVRQRGPLFEAIIRALKSEDVPVAGADRLVLTEHIAVMDLMALADCLLLPDDDLALASVLKSPLFGLTEEQLFDLAWNRKGSLRASLRAHATDVLFGAIDAELDKLAGIARRLSPFAFFADVLNPRRGRKKFLARLGPEANDALDEFLNLALDYEARETASLQGFLAWLRAAQSEVRRDMEIARDEVRVMTVHGAKGLEANTVILADTTTEPKGAHPPKLLALSNGAIVWAKRKQDDTNTMEESRVVADRAAINEYRRLLYVAMTRAAKRLVVCGSKGPNKIPDGCWYQLVHDALRSDCVREPADIGSDEVLRYRKGETSETGPAKREAAPAAGISLPPWLTRDAPTDKSAVRSITPSSAIEEETRPLAVAGIKAALLRGSLTHRLMQSLPDIPAERRAKTAQDYLAHRGSELTVEVRKAISNEVIRVLDHQRFRELFGPNSRAEVPIIGKVMSGGELVRVSGQVDRLAVTPSAVLIGDFKTNRPAPRRIEEVREGYILQLARYRAVLAKLYPDRPIRAALIWTEVPDLMELSADVLDRALADHVAARAP
ncbi:MAG TPA: double-strand break repair helicase AddA [Pseudolabrys sp.]